MKIALKLQAIYLSALVGVKSMKVNRSREMTPVILPARCQFHWGILQVEVCYRSLAVSQDHFGEEP